MHRRQVLLAAAALTAPAPAVFAQAFPTRPVRFIMPYAPGGSSEILARPIAQELTRNLGQSVFIYFKPGAAPPSAPTWWPSRPPMATPS